MRGMWERRPVVEGWVSRDPVSGRPVAIRKVSAIRALDEIGRGSYRRARAAVPRDPNDALPEVLRSASRTSPRVSFPFRTRSSWSPTILAMELRDGNLLLRPVERRDADALAAACDEDEIARFVPLMPSPYTRADADEWVERCANVWRTGESFPFAIVDAESKSLLGSIELGGSGNIGYWVAHVARGRGVATRALRLVCAWAGDRPLRLWTHPENVASQRVAENAGFRRVGTTTDHPQFRDGTREAVLFELT
jgi:RimJ/RimL family protein N-acetyltransferase